MTDAFAEQFGEATPAALQPLDLRGTIAEAVDYPVDALSPVLRDAIKAIEAIAQVPTSLAAQSVLSAAALAAQGFVNVTTITGKVIPVSLFLLSIAASGDRKSTSDSLAIMPVKEREEQLAVHFETQRLNYAVDTEAYKAATQKAKSSAKGRDEIRQALQDVGTPPIPPVQPLLTVDEPTAPGIQRLFAEAMPALGLFSDEGATFLGGWSMQDEQQASTGGMLSKLWDGAPIKRIRADKENGTQILYGRRLSLHLMVQPDIAGKLLGNKAVRNQGLLSRILVAAPKSRKGTRFWVEPSEEHRDNLAKYQARLGQLLATEFNFKDATSRALDLELVRLSPDARAELIRFSDHCEKCLGPGGKYETIADFASKMTENATRIAAVISFFEQPNKLRTEGLSIRYARAGMALMEFYASEALRLYGTSALDDDTANAEILIDWIRKRDLPAVGVRFLNRRGPPQVRSSGPLKRAIEVLIDNNHLVRIAGGATLRLEPEGKEVFYKDAYTVVPLGEA
jgi:hypothetical protein